MQFFKQFIKYIFHPKYWLVEVLVHEKKWINENVAKALLDEILLSIPNIEYTQSDGFDRRKIFFPENIIFKSKIFEDYIKPNISKKYQLALLMFNELDGSTPNIGSGEGWHRDAWFSQYKEIIFLSNVGISNGPFQFVPGSSRIIKKLISFLKGESDRLNSNIDQHYETVIADNGDRVKFDATLIHRGAPINNGFRYAMTFYYYPDFINIEKLRKKFEG